jgi:hypothetical protein
MRVPPQTGARAGVGGVVFAGDIFIEVRKVIKTDGFGRVEAGPDVDPKVGLAEQGCLEICLAIEWLQIEEKSL